MRPSHWWAKHRADDLRISALSTWPSHLWIGRVSSELCVLRLLNASLIMRLAFVSQDLEKFISVNFRRGLHMSLGFHLFEHGSYVISPTFKFQHFDISHCLFLILWFLLFTVRYSSNPLAKRCHFGHVVGTDPTLSLTLEGLYQLYWEESGATNQVESG